MQLVVPHGWGNPAERVGTPASPALPLNGAGHDLPTQAYFPVQAKSSSIFLHLGALHGGTRIIVVNVSTLNSAVSTPTGLGLAKTTGC